MSLSLHLVTWNGAKYIPYLFASLQNQTYRDWCLYILDNASTDNTVSALRAAVKDLSQPCELIENKTNLGFAGGHNQLFRRSTADYVLLLNQDLFLTEDCLGKLVVFMDNYAEAAAVAPRLMRWQFPDDFTDEIDSLGLRALQSRRVVEDGSRLQWSEVSRHCPDQPIEVFGVSGTCAIFRRSALADIAFNNGWIFDENYSSYKEDVDLAYRLRSAGWRSFVLVDTIAYHVRGAAPSAAGSDRGAMKNKARQTLAIRYNSYKNHLLTLYKNEYWQNFLLDCPWILWYELKKFVYFLIFDRGVLSGWQELWEQRKQLRATSYEIREKRRIDWREMRKWWR